MISFDPKALSPAKLQAYLQSAVAPRPIAFASTIDNEGNPNLSPFSFFNVFSSNPPILVFSPARRVRNNTTKHTLNNVQAVKEVVINVVNFDLVQQASLSSTEYPDGTNEFEKAGLTMLKSDVVK
ncbi:MAG TPA: flavin reductase family protein, partial [Flavobacteriaceae bacterium]|nr:flavin reductase family protein [Flavobacteriaceae bacterium]